MAYPLMLVAVKIAMTENLEDQPKVFASQDSARSPQIWCYRSLIEMYLAYALTRVQVVAALEQRAQPLHCVPQVLFRLAMIELAQAVVLLDLVNATVTHLVGSPMAFAFQGFAGFQWVALAWVYHQGREQRP